MAAWKNNRQYARGCHAHVVLQMQCMPVSCSNVMPLPQVLDWIFLFFLPHLERVIVERQSAARAMWTADSVRYSQSERWLGDWDRIGAYTHTGPCRQIWAMLLWARGRLRYEIGIETGRENLLPCQPYYYLLFLSRWCLFEIRSFLDIRGTLPRRQQFFAKVPKQANTDYGAATARAGLITPKISFSFRLDYLIYYFYIR